MWESQYKPRKVAYSSQATISSFLACIQDSYQLSF